jgi:membrane protease YdiL (CAAX protease family)
MKKLFNFYNIDNRKPIYILFLSFFIYFIFINFLNTYLKQFIPLNDNVIEGKQEVFLSFRKILVLLIFASSLEEVKYRLFFTKFNLNYLTISLSIVLSDIIFLIFRPKSFSLFKEGFYTVFLYYGGIILLSLLIFKAFKPIIYSNKKKIETYYKRNFIRLLFLQIIFFALWHVFFTNQTNGSHFIIVFIIQFIAALYFTIVRINYGVTYSILVHFLSNFISFLGE